MKTNKGQSLFEVLIALSIMAVIIVGLINVTTISVRNTTFSRNNSAATRYAQEAAEWLRGQRDAGWNTFVAQGTVKVHCLDTLTWSNINNCNTTSTPPEQIPNTPFFREVDIDCYRNAGGAVVLCSDASADTLQANITVRWVDAQGSHTVSTPTQFTNWRGNQ